MARGNCDKPKATVSKKFLLNLSHQITSEWKNVARNLDIDEAAIYRISRDNQDNTQEQIYQVLVHWKKKQGRDATREVLSEALKQASRKDLVDDSSSNEGFVSFDCGKQHNVTDSLQEEPGHTVRKGKTDTSNTTNRKGKYKTMFLRAVFMLSIAVAYVVCWYPSEPAVDTAGTQSHRLNGKHTENSLEWFTLTNDDFHTISGVMINTNQMVHLSFRKGKQGVVLNCFNPHSPDKEYWQYTENGIGSGVPVITSRKAIFYDGTRHVLFAVGNKVFIIHLQHRDKLYTGVDYFSVMTLGIVDSETWISSINGHHRMNISFKFLLTVSDSTNLFVCNDLGVNQIVETTDVGSSHNHLSRAAFCEGNFAIVDSSRENIILIRKERKVKQFSSLKPPISGFIPLDVICTGNRWVILYMSNNNEQNWMVASYKTKHSEDFKINDRGTFGNYLSRPVSITHYQKSGYVTFANGTVRHFRFGTWKTNSTVGDKLS